MSLAQSLRDYREARLGVLDLYLSTTLNKDPIAADWSEDYMGLTTPESKFSGVVELFRLTAGVPKAPKKTWVIGITAKFEIILAEFNSRQMARAYGHDVVNTFYGAIAAVGVFRGGSVSAVTPSTNISAGTATTFKVSINNEVAQSVTLVLTGLSTGPAIAAAIQAAVRALTPAVPANAKAYSLFTADYGVTTAAKYTLRAGLWDIKGNSVVITAGATNDVALTLKLGVANAGVETVFNNTQAYVVSATGINPKMRLELALDATRTHEATVNGVDLVNNIVTIDPPFITGPIDAQTVKDIFYKRTWIAGISRKQFACRMVYTPTNSDEAMVITYSGIVESTGGVSPNFGAAAKEAELPMTLEAIGQQQDVPVDTLGNVETTQVVAQLFEVYNRTVLTTA